MLNRWDIINHFIKKNDYKSYCELGYYKGWSFDHIGIDEDGEPILNKIAVDPNPCKNTEMENMPYGTWYTYPKGYDTSVPYQGVLKQTSDDFFSKLNSKEIKYDIIFIDGLHESEQVYKDIINSLNHLSEEGTIVLHDCNPPKYEHTTIGIDGCWTGDTYKAFIQFKYTYPEYESYVIDTDWGCGVIKTPVREGVFIDGLFRGESLTPYLQDWSLFDMDRWELLDLISVEEFLDREKIKPNEEAV